MKNSAFLLSGVSALSLAYAASAETMNPTVQSIVSAMTTGGGSETLQWQIAPNYSDLFGLGVRGTVGGYVNEDFALGVIIDYAEHREEYLANAGVRLNDNMRMIGSLGILKESEEFTLGDGREDVSQLEYGLSLKGNYDAGIVRGFEINAYHTNASSDTDAVETGDLTGIQVVTQLKPAAATDIRLGAGYEKAEWDGGDVDEGLTLQALGSHKLSDTLALNFEAKSAETENVYGLGLTYDMSTPEVQNSALSVDLMHIQGKHGISDDTRVAFNWTVGFGAAGGASDSDLTASSKGSMARADLLADVMTRPAFLPERVLAKANITTISLEFGISQDSNQESSPDVANFLLDESLSALIVSFGSITWTLYNITDGTQFRSTGGNLEGPFEGGIFDAYVQFPFNTCGNASVGVGRDEVMLEGSITIDGTHYVLNGSNYCGRD